jgi:hypothetical protein
MAADEPVQRQVELQHVDARLAKQTELAGGGVVMHKLLDDGHRHVALRGNAFNLVVGGSGRDVGIETRTGGRDQVDGNWLAGRGFGSDAGVRTVDQRLAGRPKIGAAR